MSKTTTYRTTNKLISSKILHLIEILLDNLDTYLKLGSASIEIKDSWWKTKFLATKTRILDAKQSPFLKQLTAVDYTCISEPWLLKVLSILKIIKVARNIKLMIICIYILWLVIIKNKLCVLCYIMHYSCPVFSYRVTRKGCDFNDGGRASL